MTPEIYKMLLRQICFSVCKLVKLLTFLETPAILKQNQNGGYSSQCMHC